jgi:outer membrane protein
MDDSFEKDVDALFAAGGLTADQAAARATKVSPGVKRRAAEVEVSIAQAEAAELTRIPQIGAKASYTRLSHLDPLIFAPGTPGFEFPENSYGVNGQIGVPLSDYLVRFPKIVDAAKLGLEVARASERSSEINAGQEARLAYYELVRAKLQVIVAERQQTQVQAVLKQVRALADAQRLSKADLMRVESNEAQAEQVVNQLHNIAALREEQLRLLIGAGDESITLAEDPRVDVTPPAAANLDDLIKNATRQRLEFKVFDTGIAAKEKQRDAEAANKLPRLSAFASADYANPNPRIFPQEQKWNFTWQAGVQLSWTLNDTLLARTADRRIAAETNELRADRENLLRGTTIEVMQAQQAVQLAQVSLTTSQKGLAAAEEGYRVRRELLNAERATAVELVDAETDLTRARIAALNARVDLRVALAQLAHALGNDATRK